MLKNPLKSGFFLLIAQIFVTLRNYLTNYIERINIYTYQSEYPVN